MKFLTAFFPASAWMGLISEGKEQRPPRGDVQGAGAGGLNARH